MDNAVTKPKYNIVLGLEQIKQFTPRDQVKFYREYLSHIKDNRIVSIVLKKAINQAGSFGLLDSDLIEDALTYIKAFEELKGSDLYLTDVDFNPIMDSDVIWFKLKQSINLLGIQGVNCQSTFNHRYIYSIRMPSIIKEIAKAAIHHASEEFIISPELAVELITAMEDYSKDIDESIEKDNDYTRF